MITDKMVEAACETMSGGLLKTWPDSVSAHYMTDMRAALQAAQSAAPPPSADDAPAGERERFEAAMRRSIPALRGLDFARDGDDYDNLYMQMAYAAWDARGAASDAPLCETPFFRDVESLRSYMTDLENVVAEITGYDGEDEPLTVLQANAELLRRLYDAERERELSADAPRSGDAPVAVYQWRSMLRDGVACEHWFDCDRACYENYCKSDWFECRVLYTTPVSAPAKAQDVVPANCTCPGCGMLVFGAPADARDGEHARLFRLLLDLIDQDDATVHCTMPGDGTQPDYDDVLGRDELLAHLREFPVSVDRAMGAEGGGE